MRQIIITLSLLVSLTIASAAFVGLPKEVESSLPAIKANPLASSILLWANESYELTDDGKQIYEWHSFRYLPDDMARDAWGDPHVAYIEGRETLEILASRAYTTDGRQVESTPWNAYNPITPEELQFAPGLTNFRQMVVTHLGLENGCIVEFHYRRTNNEPALPWFEGYVELREPAPTIHRTLTVKVPSGVKLQYALGKNAPEPQISGSSYVWTVKNIKGYHPDDLAGQNSLLPYVLFSTADSWKTVKAEIAKRIEAASAVDIEIPESLRKEIRNAASNLGKAPAIKEWFSERFSRYEFHHDEFDLFLRPVNEVFMSGYGNHLELAAVVSKLFKQAGLANGLVLQFSSEARVPSLVLLDNVLIDPLLKDQSVLFDAIVLCADFTRYEITGSQLLSLADNEMIEPRLASATPGSLELSLVFDELDGDTVSGHGTFTAVGRLAPQELTRRKGPVEALESYIELDGFTCDPAFTRALTNDIVMISFDFTMDALKKVDDYRALSLSAMSFDLLSPGCPLKLTERDFDQTLLMPAKLTLAIKGELPEGWTIASKPASETAQVSSVAKTVTMNEEKDFWEFKRVFDCKNTIIPVAEWPSYRAWILETVENPENVILFKAPKKEE